MSEGITRYRPPQQERRLGPLLKEMLAGADDQAPDRPGRHLETPQRFGLLPTLNFWNRRDVWKSARWLTAPVTGASMLATAIIAPAVDPWMVSLVGLACGVPVILAHGLLERYLRRRLRERRSSGRETSSEAERRALERGEALG
jgi:hypothetical protein